MRAAAHSYTVQGGEKHVTHVENRAMGDDEIFDVMQQLAELALDSEFPASSDMPHPVQMTHDDLVRMSVLQANMFATLVYAARISKDELRRLFDVSKEAEREAQG